MLTPEDKARIEAEERKRHSEDQYRAQFRAILETPARAPASVPEKSNSWLFLKILGSLCGVVALVLVISNVVSRSTATDPITPGVGPTDGKPPWFMRQYIRKSDSIVSGHVTVQHGGLAFYKITITPEMVSPIMKGTFTASGGGGNDIEGVVADEASYINWSNGHQANVFWSTQGRATTGSFELKLSPGVYYLAFSNKFSFLTDKDVLINASLSYQQLVQN